MILDADLSAHRHGHASKGKTSPTYQSWRAMHQRCECPKNKDYANYGGKGITVVSRWKLFINFLNDMGERPSKDYSLDRIDPSKDYSVDNCQWLTKSENSSKGNSQRYSERGPLWHTLICKHCGVEFKRRRCDVLRGRIHFCSYSCSTSARNLAKGKKGGAQCC